MWDQVQSNSRESKQEQEQEKAIWFVIIFCPPFPSCRSSAILSLAAVTAADTQGGSVGLTLTWKVLQVGRKKVVLFCFSVCCRTGSLPASSRNAEGENKSCATPQTAHKSADLAMRSHGVLHSDQDLAQSIQQHSIFLWVSHLSQATGIIAKLHSWNTSIGCKNTKRKEVIKLQTRDRNSYLNFSAFKTYFVHFYTTCILHW